MIFRKLTEKIWWRDELWKIVSILSPTKWDTYILAEKEDDESSHEDGTTPILMELIDVQNDTFYPNTKRVQKIMSLRNKVRKASKKDDRELDRIWLSLFPRV